MVVISLKSLKSLRDHIFHKIFTKKFDTIVRKYVKYESTIRLHIKKKTNHFGLSCCVVPEGRCDKGNRFFNQKNTSKNK